jgi:Spy/CpxP family protein refolding chaperone
MIRGVCGVLVVAALALAAGSAFAGGAWQRDPEARAQHMRERMWEHLDDVMDEIDADDKQRAAIEAIVKGLEPTWTASHKLRREARQAIKAELLKDRPDLQKVHDTVNTSSEQMTADAHKLADAALKAHAVLTADQRAELVVMFGQPRHTWDGSTTRLDMALELGLARLNATDAQRALVAKHKAELLPVVKKAHEQAQAARATIVAELAKDKPDAGLIHATIDDVSVNLTGVAHQAVEVAGELWAAATPDQRELIREKAARKGPRR